MRLPAGDMLFATVYPVEIGFGHPIMHGNNLRVYSALGKHDFSFSTLNEIGRVFVSQVVLL